MADDNPRADEEDSWVAVDEEELVKARKEALQQNQIARRAAWQEQVKTELDRRAEYKRQMEGIPRNQVTDWKDKQTLSNISTKWRNKFLTERTQFLFHEVFPILSQHKIDPDWLLPIKEILTSRKVSKAWKDAIDTSLSDTSHYPPPSSALAPHPNGKRNGRILPHSFFLLKQLQDFNEKSVRRYRGSNPFPFRHFYFGHPMAGSSKAGLPYWIEMGKLLKRWGKEIWSAVFVYDDGSIEMMYEFLISYLSLMPNLQELMIKERDRSGSHEGEDILDLLKSRMERKPLPELPCLRTIVLDEFTPLPLIKALLEKYGGALQVCEISLPETFENNFEGFGSLRYFLTGREFPFRKFSCRFADLPWRTNWEFQFPNITELDLTYLKITEVEQVENIFKTVNGCGATLRQLKLVIIFDVPEPEKDWRDRLPWGVKLDLPQLEVLDLVLEKSKITNLEFLLSLVSLKELTFYYLTMSTDGIMEFGKQLYDSNLWTLLPEIRLVILNSIPVDQPAENEDFTTSVYTRDAYRQYQSDLDGISEMLLSPECSIHH